MEKHGRELTEEELLLAEACFTKIDAEMRRLYWNRNQAEMNSPFENTGCLYEDGTFSVKAYDWGDDNDREPNFSYPGLSVWWYKRMGRGMHGVYTGTALFPSFLQGMLSACIRSLKKRYGEK